MNESVYEKRDAYHIGDYVVVDGLPSGFWIFDHHRKSTIWVPAMVLSFMRKLQDELINRASV